MEREVYPQQPLHQRKNGFVAFFLVGGWGYITPVQQLMKTTYG